MESVISAILLLPYGGDQIVELDDGLANGRIAGAGGFAVWGAEGLQCGLGSGHGLVKAGDSLQQGRTRHGRFMQHPLARYKLWRLSGSAAVGINRPAWLTSRPSADKWSAQATRYVGQRSR